MPILRLTGDEEQVGGFDLIYKNSKRVRRSNRNESMLGCFNNRDQQMRKMAKMTALRLAEKPKKKEDEKPQDRKGRSLISGPANTSKNIPTSFYKNRQAEQAVKLPKVPNSSTKNIDTKKNNDTIFRITNSKESKR